MSITDAPASCEVCAVLRFLCTTGFSAAEIHRVMTTLWMYCNELDNGVRQIMTP